MIKHYQQTVDRWLYQGSIEAQCTLEDGILRTYIRSNGNELHNYYPSVKEFTEDIEFPLDELKQEILKVWKP